jgi:flagellar protein FlgJ
MADPLSLPNPPVNVSDMVYSKERIQRSIELNRHRKNDNQTDPALRDACSKMESLFLHHLLKEMRATIDKSGFISGGRAEEIYTSLMDAEIANRISTRGGIGLADMLLHQLGNRNSKIKSEESE